MAPSGVLLATGHPVDCSRRLATWTYRSKLNEGKNEEHHELSPSLQFGTFFYRNTKTRSDQTRPEESRKRLLSCCPHEGPQRQRLSRGIFLSLAGLSYQ